jgi:NAD(P)H-dependent flavin oxidoreductase YrpB (nitropropane dioxygenase family)
LSQETLHTQICDLLNIKYPIIQAGMARGHGILAASRLTPEQLREAIHKIKSLTNCPFGVNLLLAPPEQGNHNVATAQRFLDHFGQELSIPSSAVNTNDIQLPPSTIPDHLRII